MSGIDVSELKDMQVAMEVRKNKLRKLFIRFREGLFKRLDKFANEAKTIGLRGVEPLVFQESESRIVQTVLMLNGYPLLIVGNEDALPMELESEALAFKLFVYSDYEANNMAKPWVEMTIFEAPKEAYHFKIEHPAKNEMVAVLHGTTVSHDEGMKAADALITLFYTFKRSWIKKPTLESILEGKAVSKPITH